MANKFILSNGRFIKSSTKFLSQNSIPPVIGYKLIVSSFDQGTNSKYYYSLDNGSTYTEITGEGTLVNNATQVKFKVIGGNDLAIIDELALGLHIYSDTEEAVESDNYILSRDVDGIMCWIG